MDKGQVIALEKQVMGLAGSVALFIGAFGPLGKVPLLGGITAFDFHVAYGIFIILMAVASFILVLKKHYSALWITGLVILGFVVIPPPVYMLILQLYPVGKGPFSAFTQLAGQVVSLAWGWGVLLAGGILLIASAATKQEWVLYPSVKEKGLEELIGRVITAKEFLQNWKRIGGTQVRVKGIVKNVEVVSGFLYVNTYFTLTDKEANVIDVYWEGKHDISESTEVVVKGVYHNGRMRAVSVTPQ